MRGKLIAGVGTVLVILLAVFSFQGEKAMVSDTTLVLYDSARVGVVERTVSVELREGMNEVPLSELVDVDMAEVAIRPLDDDVQVLGLFGGSGDAYSAGVGSDVEVRLRSGETLSGKFLGLRDGKIALEGDGYYLINPDEVSYFKVRDVKGTTGVHALLRADKTGRYNLSVSYRVSNVSWESRYRLYLGSNAKLDGYILIRNPTSQSFDGVNVLLMAGDVGFLRPDASYKVVSNAGEPEKVEAFYMYRLGVVDVNPASTMVYPYISQEVPFEREYLYESRSYSAEGPVYESVSLRTDKVLPAGVVEIYRETGDGPILIGERRVEHTPKGGLLRVEIGRDYDLKGRTTVLEERHNDSGDYYRVRVSLENFGNETRTVLVRHYKRGQLVSSSVAPVGETADYVEFAVTLKPGEKKEIVFDYKNGR